MCFGEAPVASNDFDDFLVSLSQDHALQNDRFVARNFLLDEGVSDRRRNSYQAAGVMARHGSFQEWYVAHKNKYFNKCVSLDKLTRRAPTYIDVSDANSCPETFRCQDSLKTYGHADESIFLIRVVEVRSIAKRTGFTVEHTIRLAEQVLSNSSEREPKLIFESHLETWIDGLRQQPSWANFLLEVEHLFAQPDWADKLRDQLGLYHFDPGKRGEAIPIFVFTYRVGDLPHLAKQKGKLRPIAKPTVLDSNFSQAFCPAPRDCESGFVMGVGEDEHLDVRLRREILHPLVNFKADHLYKIGIISRPVRADLSFPRSLHLMMLREGHNRGGYAIMTDKDLL